MTTNLSSFVIPFNVAQTLKRLGMPQKSCFYYLNMPSGMDFNRNHFILSEDALQIKANNMSYSYKEKVAFAIFSAFTLQELGDSLPAFIMKNGNKYHLYTHKYSYDENIQYFIYYAIENETNNSCAVEDHYSELLARANMLIWLIENGYVKFGENEQKKEENK